VDRDAARLYSLPLVGPMSVIFAAASVTGALVAGAEEPTSISSISGRRSVSGGLFAEG
jgi:hypothetical protein